MPSYDYECKECGHGFEAFQNMSDPLLTTCPKCGGPLRRLIGGGLGIIFKGSGFYVTDSKKSSVASTSGSGNGSGNGKSADSSGTASPKTETPKSEPAKAESAPAGA